MRRLALLLSILALATTPIVRAQPDQSADGTPVKEPVAVPVQLQNKVWFTDRVARASARFPERVEYQADRFDPGAECRILDVEVVPSTDAGDDSSLVMLRFIPSKTGVAHLPSLSFTGERQNYETVPQQILVSTPVRAEAMDLSIRAEQTEVYVGEPLRVDLAWECGLNAGALQHLELNPEFFSHPDVEVVVPRSTDPEAMQVGLPIGGRRVIARRIQNPDTPNLLGRIELSFYIRITEPGRIRFEPTRLECVELSDSRRDFGRYAAYFNNSLFEAVDPESRYRRVYTSAAALEITAHPLPANGVSPLFSGLFKPVEVRAALHGGALGETADRGAVVAAVGDLLELTLEVRGKAPHGMLTLPPLSQQPGLRERFLVDDEPERIWLPGGSAFRYRLRPLSTSIRAVPSLRIPVFDPVLGAFTRITTEPIPLRVEPSGGREYIALRSFDEAAIKLTSRPEGVWHNLKSTPMNEILHGTAGFVRQFLLPLLLLGPILFALLLPWVIERRRRASDARYRRKALALAAFKRAPADSREKWQAFTGLLAAISGSRAESWTAGDSARELRRLGVGEAELDEVMAVHRAIDASTYGRTQERVQFDRLDHLAKRIFRLASRALLVAWIGMVLWPTPVQANWDEAERLFAEAIEAPAGSDASVSLYRQAALHYEESARSSARYRGVAWVNAGNSWTQVGDVGRGIACFRQALEQRPFDRRLRESLAAARAMTVNDVPAETPIWRRVPASVLRLALVASNLAFWGLLLLWFRYRSRPLDYATAAAGLVLLTLTTWFGARAATDATAGVVIVDAVEARKGPAYAYAPAFNEPLLDGLEFTLRESRGDWLRIELSDHRQCWIPEPVAQLIEKR